MIELAQVVWRTDLEGTILKLVARGCDLPVDNASLTAYRKDHVDRRKALTAFWEQSRQQLAVTDSAQIANLLQKLRLTKTGQATTWLARGGRFLGCSDAITASSMLFPKAAACRKRIGRSRPQEVFKGAKWGDVLVMPFSDLPGRISAFMFVGREGEDAAGDCVFHNVRNFDRTTLAVLDPGVTMMPTLLAQPNHYLGDAIFAFSGAVPALRMQLRWLQDNSSPLPIVGLFHNRTQQPRMVWQDMPARDYIFCAPNAEPHVMAQAARAGGSVATNRSAQADLGDYFRKHSPMDLLKLMRRSGEPWRDVFQTELMRKDIARAEELFLKMQLSEPQLAVFMSNDENVRARIDLIRKRSQLHKTLVVQSRTIRETEDGWVLEPRRVTKAVRGQFSGGESICNAVIRLTNVIGSPSGRSYYRGHIAFQGKDIPFFANTRDVDRNAMAWCDEFLKQNGHGSLIYDTAWGRRSAMIAKQFHQPQYIQGLENVGWSAEQAVFAFPRFAINTTGRPAENCEVMVADTATPAARLEPPEDLDRRDILALSQTDESTKLFWLAAISIIHNVLAPAMRFDPRGLALVGEGGQAVGVLAAKMLGCELLKSELRIGSADKLQASCDAHAWPALLTQATERVVAEWLAGGHSRNCVINTNWFTAKVLAARGPWIMAESDTPLCDLRQLLSTAGKLIPAYLQRLCRNRLQLPRGDTMLAICKDLGNWLEDENGDATPLKQVARALSAQMPSADTIGHILGKGIHEGLFEYVQKGLKITNPGELYLVYDEEGDTVWVPQQSLSRLLSRKGAPPLDTQRVTELLGKHLLRQDTYTAGVSCWVLPAAWVTKQVKKWDAVGPNLKLAT